MIYYVSSCHPGCRHDSAVFKDTPLFRHLMSGWRPFEDGIILGDAGYPVSIKCNKLISIFIMKVKRNKQKHFMAF